MAILAAIVILLFGCLHQCTGFVQQCIYTCEYGTPCDGLYSIEKNCTNANQSTACFAARFKHDIYYWEKSRYAGCRPATEDELENCEKILDEGGGNYCYYCYSDLCNYRWGNRYGTYACYSCENCTDDNLKREVCRFATVTQTMCYTFKNTTDYSTHKGCLVFPEEIYWCQQNPDCVTCEGTACNNKDHDPHRPPSSHSFPHFTYPSSLEPSTSGSSFSSSSSLRPTRYPFRPYYTGRSRAAEKKLAGNRSICSFLSVCAIIFVNK